MPKKITITCPACSAELSTPTSAAGKTLHCPRCRTGIPVPKPEETAISTAAGQTVDPLNIKSRLNTEVDATAQMPLKSATRRFSRRMVGLALLTLIGFAIWGAVQSGIFRSSKSIEIAPQANDFNGALALEPNPVDGLIVKVRQQLMEPRPDIDGIVHNLDRIQQLAPDPHVQVEILPLISIARSLQHVRAGELAAAHQELEKAARLGAKEPQLFTARETLIEAYVALAESNIGNERFKEALTNCDSILKLEGTEQRVAPLQAKAWIAMAERAVTEQELQNAITALEPLRSLTQQEQVADELTRLYFRHSKLAYSECDLDVAVRRFLQCVSDSQRNAEILPFGVRLAEATVVAAEADPTQENRDLAFLIAECLDKNVVDAKAFLLIKLRLVTAMLSDPESKKRDEDLDFAARSVAQALSSETPIEPHRVPVRALSRSLRDRGLNRASNGRVNEGIDDLRLAIVMAPGLKEALMTDVKRLPRPVRGLLPQDLFDASSLDTNNQLWARIPATAEVFSVVRDMEEFSDEVCEVSNLLSIPMPHLLIAACQLSGIDVDLRKTGSLGLVKLPVAKDNKPETTGSIFLLPTSDFRKMIKPLQAPGKKNQVASNAKVQPVLMNGSSGFAASSESYGAFAFAADKKSLYEAVEFEQDIRQEMIPFEDYGEDLDAYLVVTPQGVRNGLEEFRIPFSTRLSEILISLGRTAIPGSVAVVGQDPLPISQWLRQLAIGLAIQPDQGIAVRSRLWGDQTVDLKEMLSVNRGGSEKSLDLLPNEPFLFASGCPVSAKQCELLSDCAERMFPDQQKPQVRITDLQIALLVPEDPPVIAEPQAQTNLQTIYSRLQKYLVVVVRLNDSQSALDDIEARYTQLAGPAAPAVERLAVNGVAVLRIAYHGQVNDQIQSEPIVLSVATPNNDTLVCTYGDEAQLTRAMAPSLGAAGLSTSATVRTAVRMLPESTSSLVVLDL